MESLKNASPQGIFMAATVAADAADFATAEVAMSLDPSLAETHYYLGNLALTNGKLDEATKQLQAAVQLDPSSSKAHFALSRALRQQGRNAESAPELGIYQELKRAEDGAAGPAP